MSSGHSREHPSTRPQQTHTISANPGVPEGNPIEVDDESFISPQVRALLEQAAETTGLEVDDDDGDDEAEVLDGDDESGRSIYAMSMYPDVQPVYHVEDRSDSGHDEITMCVASTLARTAILGRHSNANRRLVARHSPCMPKISTSS
jgi:hypothetical protein